MVTGIAVSRVLTNRCCRILTYLENYLSLIIIGFLA